VDEYHWNVEIRIPVVQDDNDPLHQVVGRKPTGSLPWHFNVCRQRIRESGAEYSAFSPTGEPGFHQVLKFAQLYEGKSRQFPHDAPAADYLEARRAASKLVMEREYGQALAALTAMAEGDVTDLQKSDALEQAAACALRLEQFDRAMELAERIPIEAVAGTVRMRNLMAMRKSKELVAQFKDEDVAGWPFWKAGEGLYLRGRAHADNGAGREAEADLAGALELTTDTRARLDVWLALGANRENNLKDDAAALKAYQQIAGASKNTGSATYYRGMQGAARILRKSGQLDDALATLQQVDVSKLRGYWHGSMLVALGETLTAAGRKDEALAAYRQVLKDETVSAADRRAAEAAITRLTHLQEPRRSPNRRRNE
jgi:tetratricopeptide (TPR) repeat protein